MAKRSPERSKAYELYKAHNGDIQIREIARQLDVPEKTISGWKCKDKWELQLTGVYKPVKRSTPKQKRKKRSTPVEVSEETKLTEKQRLFCLYYVKNYNATQAALKAGYSSDSAHVIGSDNLRNPKIAAEIRRVKGSLVEDLHFDAQDVLMEYAKIAFSNIGEYVEFGQKEVPVIQEGKIVKDPDTGEPITYEKSFVSLRESKTLDGSIITEVSQGREGIKIKFADKMKALEKLERYFDLLPDVWKRKLEEEKLEIEKRKIESGDPAVEGAKTRESVNSFVGALGMAAEEVWENEK
jgi:phage terminase small subunit